MKSIIEQKYIHKYKLYRRFYRETRYNLFIISKTFQSKRSRKSLYFICRSLTYFNQIVIIGDSNQSSSCGRSQSLYFSYFSSWVENGYFRCVLNDFERPINQFKQNNYLYQWVVKVIIIITKLYPASQLFTFDKCILKCHYHV